MVDGFNTQVIGYIAPQIAKTWDLSRDVLGWILAADKIGLLIGYLFGSIPFGLVLTMLAIALWFHHVRPSIGAHRRSLAAQLHGTEA